ncbi:ABC transporter substrate-binding protein [Amnibacterium sp.]|uniref:ABC transporter substrate-binding protein n=1 Tax=Amnibacterium sp. TaxID=1872496 RepID=UPI003F7B7948
MVTTKFHRARVLALASVLAVGAIALTACSSGSSGAAPTAGGDATGQLNILVSSAPGSDAGFQAVTKAFEKKYPKVTVNLSAVPNENYNQARSSRLTAGSVDIVVAAPRQVPSYVPASNEGDDARLADQGGYLDLTNESFMKSFNPTVLNAAKYKGKNYTVPTGLSYYTGMFYNKKIFTDNNLKVPTTWSDLLKTCAALKAKGVVPFGIAGKDSAGVMTLGVTEGLYPSADAMNTLAKDLYAGKTKLNTGKPLDLMKKVQTLYGYAEPNFAGVSYATMTADFVNGKFAMMPDGTWNTTTLQKSGAGKLDFGYVPLPSSDTAADNANLGGKVELSLAVPANAKNQKAAIQWLDFFTKNYKLFNDQAGFAPAVQGATSDPFYTSIQPYTKTFLPAWDTIWITNTKAGPAASVPFNWAGIAPMGNADAQGAADAAQHDWQAGLGK